MPSNAGNKLAVLASGSGSNLQALIDARARGDLHGEVALVVSDRRDAFALERARAAGIPARWIDPKAAASREAYDAALSAAIRASGASWVVLAGYMRILGAPFVRAFPGRILNIHPSLLPAYPGVRSIERALAAGERETGVTVHFVDAGVDTGPVVAQERVAIPPGATLDALTERVHAAEHALFYRAINMVLAGKVVYREKP